MTQAAVGPSSTVASSQPPLLCPLLLVLLSALVVERVLLVVCLQDFVTYGGMVCARCGLRAGSAEAAGSALAAGVHCVVSAPGTRTVRHA
jgi:hypothetical protein